MASKTTQPTADVTRGASRRPFSDDQRDTIKPHLEECGRLKTSLVELMLKLHKAPFAIDGSLAMYEKLAEEYGIDYRNHDEFKCPVPWSNLPQVKEYAQQLFDDNLSSPLITLKIHDKFNYYVPDSTVRAWWSDAGQSRNKRRGALKHETDGVVSATLGESSGAISRAKRRKSEVAQPSASCGDPGVASNATSNPPGVEEVEEVHETMIVRNYTANDASSTFEAVGCSQTHQSAEKFDHRINASQPLTRETLSDNNIIYESEAKNSLDVSPFVNDVDLGFYDPDGWDDLSGYHVDEAFETSFHMTGNVGNTDSGRSDQDGLATHDLFQATTYQNEDSSSPAKGLSISLQRQPTRLNQQDVRQLLHSEESILKTDNPDRANHLELIQLTMLNCLRVIELQKSTCVGCSRTDNSPSPREANNDFLHWMMYSKHYGVSSYLRNSQTRQERGQWDEFHRLAKQSVEAPGVRLPGCILLCLYVSCSPSIPSLDRLRIDTLECFIELANEADKIGPEHPLSVLLQFLKLSNSASTYKRIELAACLVSALKRLDVVPFDALCDACELLVLMLRDNGDFSIAQRLCQEMRDLGVKCNRFDETCRAHRLEGRILYQQSLRLPDPEVLLNGAEAIFNEVLSAWKAKSEPPTTTREYVPFEDLINIARARNQRDLIDDYWKQAITFSKRSQLLRSVDEQNSTGDDLNYEANVDRLLAVQFSQKLRL